MAAIHDPLNELDMNLLADSVKKQLPAFARPLFVRLVKNVDITGMHNS